MAMDAGDWIALIGVPLTLATLVFGLVQYGRAQKWKRLEFVANAVKAFEGDPMNRNAMLMLDWNGRALRLVSYAEAGDAEDAIDAVVTDDIVRGALVHHREKQRFTEVEAAIRDTFDHFFESLERFEHFIESGLIRTPDVEPYLRYWIEIIAGRRPGTKDEAFIANLWSYIRGYGYDGVESLVGRFGFEVA